jgi:hypothetical protein
MLMLRTVPPFMKFDPVIVTATVVPRSPEVGEIFVITGAGGLTVNEADVVLVPVGVVTVMLRTPVAAAGAIVRVALRVVEF